MVFEPREEKGESNNHIGYDRASVLTLRWSHTARITKPSF